jgi:hypothetical protein
MSDALKRIRRFERGRFVIFRDAHDGRRYFAGQFDDVGFPRETRDGEKAKVFQSAAHGCEFGEDRPSLQAWRVGRA